MKLYKIFCLLFICSCGGTNTGNPNGSPPSSSPIQDLGIRNNICTQLQACYPGDVNITTCESDLLTDTNAPTLLGLSSSDYANLSAVETAFGTGSLRKNLSNANACLGAIEALSCSDPILTGAYDSGHPTDYTKAANLLNASATCGNFFLGH